MTDGAKKRVHSVRSDAIAVVVPTLNAARSLAGCIGSLESLQAAETVVVDGGSTDGTAGVAASLGADFVQSAAGRGRQMAAGAAVTVAPWLLFVHADTRLDAAACAAFRAYAGDPANRGKAAYLSLRFDDDGRSARWVETWVAIRCRLFALPFGDQSLLIARSLYEEVGGFRPMPLMEDVDLVDRLGRRRLQLLPGRAVTSAERYRREGYLPRGLRNLLCFGLYRLGVPPDRLLRLYYAGRAGTGP